MCMVRWYVLFCPVADQPELTRDLYASAQAWGFVNMALEELEVRQLLSIVICQVCQDCSR